tara:strand:- start:854 stop:1543 length:690 start_codon:yes stop_codon:yes gene_type:complete
VNNTKAEIALITNNSGLGDLLEESFLMYGKFPISLYSNSSISNLIKKIDIFDVILISNDVLDESDKEIIDFLRGIGKKSIYLTKNNIKKNVFKNKGISPRSIINIPFSFYNIVQQIEIFIRENSKKMNDIRIGNFFLNVHGRKIILNNAHEKLTEKETEILWKLLNKIEHKISQKDLLKEIWGYDEGIETRTLETHIYRIRKKLNSVGAKNYKINNIDNSYVLSVDKVN